MQDEYIVKFHPEFFDDLKKLDRKEKEIVNKLVKKIKTNPTRFKHMHGKENRFRVRAGNLRIVYYLEKNTIWFLVAERRDTVYAVYFVALIHPTSQIVV